VTAKVTRLGWEAVCEECETCSGCCNTRAEAEDWKREHNHTHHKRGVVE
jgi:hypothetical protein